MSSFLNKKKDEKTKGFRETIRFQSIKIRTKGQTS